MKGKIFNAQEVQAIIAGNKTQFREVVKKQNEIFLGGESGKVCWHKDLCPYQVGQEIFCKESFLQKICATQLPSGEHETFFYGSEVEYVADGAQERWDNPNVSYPNWWKKRPAQHMKQEHSRITLRIKSVKVERLRDISEEDAIKDGGVFKSDNYWHSTLHPTKQTYQCWTSAKEAFAKLWNSTHKKPEEKWEANPFVWVVDFKVNK